MIGLDTWGLDVVLWFQSWRTPLVETYVLIFHELGQFIPYMLLLPFFYWCMDRHFGARLAGWFLAGVYLNSALKAVFGLPRPYFDPANGVHNVVEDVGNGLPSGHAQIATTFWGLVASWARRRWVWLAVVPYLFLIGLSRVVAGVHYPQDVLAGWLFGSLWVWIYAGLDRPLTGWLARWPLWAQLALALAVGLVNVALLPTEDGATYGGALLGLGVGLVLVERWARFEAGGAWGRRVARYGVGLTGLLALYLGLRAVFAGLEPELAWRFLRYGLMGAWVTLGAPWAFIRLGLASEEV